MFLEPGENGEMSQKEQLEQELITLQVETKRLQREQKLKAELFTNQITDV